MAGAQQTNQGDPFAGPPYDAPWQVDTAQSSKNLIDRHRRNAANPAAHEVYRKQVEDKEAQYGVIHFDPITGYRARFKPAGTEAKAPAQRQEERPPAAAAEDPRDVELRELRAKLVGQSRPAGGQE